MNDFELTVPDLYLISGGSRVNQRGRTAIPKGDTQAYYFVIFFIKNCMEMKDFGPRAVADPGFSKWGGAVLSQMGGAHPVFR